MIFIQGFSDSKGKLFFIIIFNLISNTQRKCMNVSSFPLFLLPDAE